MKTEYGTSSEHLWASYPTYEVLRHAQQPGEKKAKWYGIIMDVKRSVLGMDGDDYVDILDVKPDPETIDFLRHVNGYFPAYHMNKQSWITILLDGTVPFENIKQQIDESYAITASAKEKKIKRVGPKDWIVPANPKYFDLIYMYVAAPYSAIMYKCKAIEVDIPSPKRAGERSSGPFGRRDYEDRDLVVKKVMKIQLLASYGSDFMLFDRMKDEFGVYAVRGPRSMPNSLKEELTAYEGEL